MSDPDATAAALATALDVPARRDVDPTGRLVAYLSDKQVLLVLDNCEHLLESVAALVHELIDSVRVSQCWPRHVLRWRSKTSSCGHSGRSRSPPRRTRTHRRLPSVQLFVTRASAQAPDFALDNDNSADISEICRRLDGVPLAIELAAARMPALSPADLAARLSWRFRLLRGGPAPRRSGTER